LQGTDDESEEGRLRSAVRRDCKGRIAGWIGSIPSAAEAALDVVLTAGLKPRPFKVKAEPGRILIYVPAFSHHPQRKGRQNLLAAFVFLMQRMI
jgi:hypothetical protein